MNKEISKYQSILCNYDYPFFIEKYLELEEFKRIDSIGMLCGADYSKIFNLKYFYSRCNHSVSTALMAWNYTNDKTQTICSLLHDLGTPAFSHCVDYLMKDSEKQESSEKNIYEIVNNSIDLKNYLAYDKINIEDLKNYNKYTIIENEKPKLCTDRLDGIFVTGMIWLNKYNINQISTIYENTCILKNEYNEEEIGFKNIEYAEDFFQIVYDYSMVLQSNKDKFLMQYTADALKKIMENGNLSLENLYTLKEIEVVKKLEDNVNSWNIFVKTLGKNVRNSNILPNQYCVSINSKKRYVVPLVLKRGKVYRLNEVSNYCKSLLEKYNNFMEKEYAYVKRIKKV